MSMQDRKNLQVLHKRKKAMYLKTLLFLINYMFSDKNKTIFKKSVIIFVSQTYD